MAFTDSERVLIHEYLGWNSRFRQSDTGLTRAISAIEMQAAEEARARDHLAELQRIDAALVGSESRFKADQVGTIKLSESELTRLRSRGEERVGRLARLFGVETRGGAYSPSPSRWRSGAAGPTGGGNSQMQG